MRGKKAKLVRAIARDICIDNIIQQETQYDAKENSSRSQGTFVVSHCERAVVKQVKQVAHAAKNLPARFFQQIAYRAID